tara:strand:- start:508 stop:762 length:255 start_codon:yes stop_codon:yes gene_type:complete
MDNETMELNMKSNSIHQENVKFMNYIIMNNKFDYFKEDNIHVLYSCLLQSTISQMLLLETKEQVKLKVNKILDVSINGIEMSQS